MLSSLRGTVRTQARTAGRPGWRWRAGQGSRCRAPADRTYGGTVARLVLINGAPGSGKSTLAHALAARRPLALALDVDQLKHALA